MRRMFKNHQHEALSAWSEVKLGLKGLRKMEKVLLEAKSGRDGEPDNDDTAETLNGRLLKDEVTDFIGILEHKIVAFEAVMETWEL